ncbi:MAG: hypothetical protein EOO02_09540 [Chitinophagaceae bacterium]|nr:MAG: hypothetical protein EOO02_09540 [Chitinophagaceae bacterium]
MKTNDVVKTNGKSKLPQDNLLEQINLYEREKHILLALGDDITKVRQKTDLITLFSKRIKGLFHFTHSIVSLIDEGRNAYSPFCLTRRPRQ